MDRLMMVGLSASLALAGCGDNRLVECQAIMQLAAQTESIKPVSDESLKPDLDLWREAAVALESKAQQLEDLKISNSQLQEYQQGLSRVYRENAIATQKMVQARQNRDLQQAEAAQQQVKAAGELEVELVEGINRYCLDTPR
jgi:hypothetical protein